MSKIDELYRKLDKLLSQEDNLNNSQINTLLCELREEQEIEADRIGAVLEASLSMPIDVGQCAIERINTILVKYKKRN